MLVAEMLQKDMKLLRGSHFTVAMCSITVDMEDVLSSPEFSHDAMEFCLSLPADVIVIMTVLMGDAGVSRRCIAVFSHNRIYREQITDVLLRSTSPNLDLHPLTSCSVVDHVSAFVQNNTRVSRKGVLPLIRDFITGQVEAPDENVNACGNVSQFRVSPNGQDGHGKRDSSEEETRRHINLAKAFQCDKFRTSQDRYDLAAVGTDALISPSLSSDSELGNLGRHGVGEEEEGLEDILEEEGAVVAGGRDGAGSGGVGSARDGSYDSAIAGNSYSWSRPYRDAPMSGGSGRGDGGCGGVVIGNLIDYDTGSERRNIMSGKVGIVTSRADDEDVLQNHSPFDLLCPNNVDSPAELSSLPTSGQASGQGSKVPSYPDTPPNSYMEPSGAVYFKETQLPSFNSSEMVRRIHEKKAALARHSGKKKRSRNDNFYDDDNDDDVGEDDGIYFAVGANSDSGGGTGTGTGSLVSSPAVPHNSFTDVSGLTHAGHSSGLPARMLTNSEMVERVNEKRSQLSQFEWSLGSLDNTTSTSGVDVGHAGPNSDSAGVGQRFYPGDGDVGVLIPASPCLDPPTPFTPNNSFVEGNFDSFSRSNLPSLNSAEVVAKIKAKQAAMFGGSGSGSSSRVSRSSHGSDDSGGCHSPDVKGSKGASLDSPLQPYTPQNSYRDGIGALESRNRLPDLNEVAERLSTENATKRQKHGKRSTSNSGGGSRDEENVNLIVMPSQNQGRHARTSSSQSDSQNTMSDVDSLLSVSTDVGTPSENVVASGIAGQLRSDIAVLTGRDTNDSDVFTPGQVDDRSGSTFSPSKLRNIDLPTRAHNRKTVAYEDEVSANPGTDNLVRNGFSGAKELFSPVDSDRIQSVEDHAFFEAAESIVAQSVAAALQVRRREGHPGHGGGRLRWSENLEENCVNNDSGEGNHDDEDEAFDEQCASSKDCDHDDPAGNIMADGDLAPDDEAEEGQLITNQNSDMENESSHNVVSHNVARDMVADYHTTTNSPQRPHPPTHSSPQNSWRHHSGRHANAPESSHIHGNHATTAGNNAVVSGNDGTFSSTTTATPASAATAAEQSISDLALNELAFELANELIQSVLEDFPFSQEAADSSHPDRQGRVSAIRGGRASERIGGHTDFASTAGGGDPNSVSLTSGQDRKFSGSLLEARKCTGSSLDSNSSSSSSERKRSRDTDSSMTIMEDEVVMTFPDRKPSSEFITVEEEEEIIKSFPGRKFSKSEDFPPRRFSRDEDLSRRSSRLDDSDLEISIGPEDVETDYLPNMDPLQGNLDIIDASFTKITDVDREVVEGESFRKVSKHELENEAEREDVENAKLEYDAEAAWRLREERKRANEGGGGGGGGILTNSTSRGNGVNKPGTEEQTAEIKKVTPKKRKKIRVSFSEDFDDEIGDFNIASSSRSQLRSPPPPIVSQDSTTSSPPPMNLGQQQADLEMISQEIVSQFSAVPVSFSTPPPPPSESQSARAGDGHRFQGREVYHTTAGRISIEGEEEEHATASSSGRSQHGISWTKHSDNKQGAVYSEEWQDDEISEMARHPEPDSPPADSLRKKIVPDSKLAQGVAADVDDDDEEEGEAKDEEEDDGADVDSEAGDLEWENDTPIKPHARHGNVESASPTEERQQRWKRVSATGSSVDIDLLAVSPFRNVLAHGGYYDEGLSAIIVFYGCNLPSRRRADYAYVMNHLFHYVIHTLEELVADDYVIIYFHGSTPRRQMPGLGWLKRCYHSIDRRLKKNLKGLFLVHPTLWLKTVVTMTRPFISSKFSSKLKFVSSLEELNSVVPMANVALPDIIVHYDIYHEHLPSPPSSTHPSPSQ